MIASNRTRDLAGSPYSEHVMNSEKLTFAVGVAVLAGGSAVSSYTVFCPRNT